MAISTGRRGQLQRTAKRVFRGAIAATPALIALIAFNSDTAHAANQYWDSNGTTAGAGAAPTGTWGVDSFWNDQSDGGGAGVIGTWTPGSTAVFSAGTDAVGPFTVNISGTQTTAGINIEEGTMTFTGGSLDLGATGTTIDTASGTNATIATATVITGAGRLTKSGAGRLVIGTALNTPNTFTGGVAVTGGVLEYPGEITATAGAPNALGIYPAAPVADYIQLSNGATLRCTRVSTGSSSMLLVNRGMQLGTGGGQIEVTDPVALDSVLYAGIISGSGPLKKIGPGTVQLQGVSTYTGDTYAIAGGLGLGASTTLGNQAGTLHLDGGFLVAFASRSANPILNPLVMTADTTIQNNGATSGTRTFPFNNSSITTTGGTMTIKNVGAAASGLAVRFLSDGFNFTQPIVIDRGTNLGISRLEFLTDSGGTNGTHTFSGVISGNGTIRRTSAGDGTGGNSELDGANTYSGGTEINGGYIGLGVDSVGPVGALTSGPLGVSTVTFGASGTDDPTEGFYAVGGPRVIGNDITLNIGTKVTLKGVNPITLSGPIALTNLNRTFNVTNSALTTFSNAIGGAAAIGITKEGTGTLVLSGANTYSGNTTVNDGKLVLAQSQNSSPNWSVQNSAVLELKAGSGAMLKTTALSIGAGAKVDIQNNKIATSDAVGTWNGTNYDGVTGLIATGRNGGGWGGTGGIVTSQTQATTSNITSIGVASAAQVKGITATATTVFGGQTVTGSDTLVMYTYGGDANLDGKINVDDYTRIDFNVPLGSSGWYNGDFNYDGKINVDDYTIIDFNVGIQGAQFPTGAGGLGGVTAVPEPASLGLLGLAAAATLRRRRRD
jgi:fibronectin-binding autotransporter adhesin